MACFSRGSSLSLFPKELDRLPLLPILMSTPRNESIPFWTKSAKVAMTVSPMKKKDTSS